MFNYLKCYILWCAKKLHNVISALVTFLGCDVFFWKNWLTACNPWVLGTLFLCLAVAACLSNSYLPHVSSTPYATHLQRNLFSLFASQPLNFGNCSHSLLNFWLQVFCLDTSCIIFLFFTGVVTPLWEVHSPALIKFNKKESK